MAKKNTELAVAESFQLVKRYEGLDPELLAELKDELEDLDPENGIACRKVKVPSGGGIAYEVQGEDDDDATSMQEIDAVVVFTHRLSGYWPGAYGGGDQNKAPTCASMDGKTGVVQSGDNAGEVRDCENCPYNQYGTAIDQAGNLTRGKACKNMRRLYFMMSGDPNLYLLSVPPTSIRDVNKQLAKILGGGTPYVGLVLKLTLAKEKNANGVTYSKVVIKRSGTLPPAITGQVKELRRQIKDQYQNMAITMDDYASSEAPTSRGGGVDVYPTDEEVAAMDGGASFEEAPPHTDDDLPFA